jgi:hypothetical protein
MAAPTHREQRVHLRRLDIVVVKLAMRSVPDGGDDEHGIN